MPLPHHIAIVSLTQRRLDPQPAAGHGGDPEAGHARLRADLGLPGDGRRVRRPARRCRTTTTTSCCSGTPSELRAELDRRDRRGAGARGCSTRSSATTRRASTSTRSPASRSRSSRSTDAWTVVLSHEVLEMLADPCGNHLSPRRIRRDPTSASSYLVEVCDPCQSIWYPVNGVPVSDFYTPRYFDPVAIPGVRYSFTGAIEQPAADPRGRLRDVPRPAPTPALYQQRYGADEPVGWLGLAGARAQHARRCARSSTRTRGRRRSPSSRSARRGQLRRRR